MRKQLIGIGFAGWAALGAGCGKSAPPAAATQAATNAATTAAATSGTAASAADAGSAKAAPADPKEWEVVLAKGKGTLTGAQRERFEILSQADDLKFDDAHKAQQDAFKALRKKVEEFAIGESGAELATAPKRVCALIEDVRQGAQKLVDDGNAEIKTIDDQQKELEAKQKDGGKVAQQTWDKLDDSKKAVSVPVLGARYVFLALKTILAEAGVLVEFGPHEGHLAFKECLGAIAKNPISFDLTEQQLEKVLERANYFAKLQ